MQLEAGQVAAITGGASGLGFALAQEFGARGLALVLADVEEGPLRAAVERLEAAGVAVLGVPTDVRDADQVEALAAATLDRFGRVDVVCNNAGVTAVGPPMWEMPAADWEWVLGVNLGGVIHGIRSFVPHLVAQNSGHVVITASMSGLSVPPLHGPYVASKHAVVGLGEALERELAAAAPGVGVTVVCPGVVETNIIHSDRNRPGGRSQEAPALSGSVLETLVEWSRKISGPPMSAAAAAQVVVRAIEANRLHAAPNASLVGVKERLDTLLADLEKDCVDPGAPPPEAI